MADKAHETLGVPVSFVVANPSSYTTPEVLPAISRPLRWLGQ